jgi:hypothetical protein
MRLSLLVVAVALVALPMAASAQIPLMPGSMELSAGGGTSIPFGDFNTVAKTGYGLGVQGSFYVAPNIAIGGTIGYNSYGVDPAYDPSGDASMTIWEFSGQGKYLFMPGPVSPYAKASMGMYHSKASAYGMSASSSDLGIGGGLGAQLRLPTSNIGFFGEVMANSIFTEGSSTNFYSVRAGINLSVNPRP